MGPLGRFGPTGLSGRLKTVEMAMVDCIQNCFFSFSIDFFLSKPAFSSKKNYASHISPGFAMQYKKERHRQYSSVRLCLN